MLRGVLSNRIAFVCFSPEEARGLRVRIITDNRQAEVPGADAARLSKSGLEVRVDRSWYAMHHKFASWPHAYT
eukprot:g19672.t1